MKELLLIVTIAGQRVALPSASVESVVELDTLIPVPRAAPLQSCSAPASQCWRRCPSSA